MRSALPDGEHEAAIRRQSHRPCRHRRWRRASLLRRKRTRLVARRSIGQGDWIQRHLDRRGGGGGRRAVQHVVTGRAKLHASGRQRGRASGHMNGRGADVRRAEPGGGEIEREIVANGLRRAQWRRCGTRAA